MTDAAAQAHRAVSGRTASATGALRRAHSGALACAGIALVSLVAWAFVTPPFQAPDEPTHLAYVQRLAETGRAPSPNETDRSPLSSQLEQGLAASGFSGIIGIPFARAPASAAEQRRADAILQRHARQDDGGGALAYSSYPPLYYALASVPYLAADASGATIIGTLTAVRLLSCLISALTVLLIYMFVREVLPRSRITWAPAALAVGLMPYFGFIGSSVNSDVLVAALAAALLLALARAFRLGITVRRATAIGIVIALGVLTKPIFYGLLPGAAIGVLILLARGRRSGEGRVGASIAAFGAAVLLPVLAYVALSLGVWNRPLGAGAAAATLAGSAAAPVRQRSLTGLLSYAWQFWLPRPAFLTDQVGGTYPLWETMFKGFIGRFGWLDYQFPAWVYSAALVIWVGLLALVARALIAGRALVGSRLGELATYAAMLPGVMFVIAVPAYTYRLDTGFSFEQARYLFPLLALYALLVGLAVTGAGRRFGAYVAIVVVLLTGALNVAGLLMTLGRYYG